MGIGYAGLHILLPVLRDLGSSKEQRALLLGTQDIALTYDQVETFLKANGLVVEPVPAELRRTTDSFAYVSHADWWRYRSYMHQETLFRLIGVDPSRVDTLDVDAYEHANIVQDLNRPVPQHLGGYDLILNQGTLEHIFDVKQALWNLSDLTKPGGRIVHMVPAGMLNHGFYNFNACLFADFYSQSGWAIEELYYTLLPVGHIGSQSFYARIDPAKIEFIPEGFYLNIYASVRKPVAPTSTNVIAVQGLYQALHDAWKRQSRSDSVHTGPAEAQQETALWMSRGRAKLNRWRALKRLEALGADVVLVNSPGS